MFFIIAVTLADREDRAENVTVSLLHRHASSFNHQLTQMNCSVPLRSNQILYVENKINVLFLIPE